MKHPEYLSMCLGMVAGSLKPTAVKDLPPCRPETIEEVLIDFGENYQEQSISKVIADLRQLYKEEEA